MIIEDTPPIHAMFPFVTNLHKHRPIIPSGWMAPVSVMIFLGIMNTAYMMSDIARLTIR